MNRFKLSMLGLMSALRPINYEDGQTPRGRTDGDGRKSSGKTKKGASHIVGKKFRSIRLSPYTPAKYRHLHLGKRVKNGSEHNL